MRRALKRLYGAVTKTILAAALLALNGVITARLGLSFTTSLVIVVLVNAALEGWGESQ